MSRTRSKQSPQLARGRPKSVRPWVAVGLVVLAALGVLAVVFGKSAIVWHRVNEASEALADRREHAALAHLESASETDPESAEVQFLLARAYRRLGRMDDARAHLRAARSLGTDLDRVRREQWLAMAQAGQLREAEPHLAEMLEDPGDDGREICEAFVNGYFINFRFGAALRLLDAWEGDFPADWRPHEFRGEYLKQQSDLPGAEQAFQQAVDLAPNRAGLRLKLADVLVGLHRYEDAAEQYRHCLDERPDDVEVLSGWGTCLMGMGRDDEARRAFKRVLASNPDHRAARLAMGRLERDAGRPERAMEWLESAVKDDSHDLEARYVLGTVLQMQGETEEAAGHFKFVSEAREALSRVHNLTDRASKRPDDAELKYEIGSLLLKYGDASEGAAWLRSVLELDPDHQPTHRVLATHYSETGSAELASKHRSRISTAEEQ